MSAMPCPARAADVLRWLPCAGDGVNRDGWPSPHPGVAVWLSHMEELDALRWQGDNHQHAKNQSVAGRHRRIAKEFVTINQDLAEWEC